MAPIPFASDPFAPPPSQHEDHAADIEKWRDIDVATWLNGIVAEYGWQTTLPTSGAEKPASLSRHLMGAPIN